jgi:hypothetical protein
MLTYGGSIRSVDCTKSAACGSVSGYGLQFMAEITLGVPKNSLRSMCVVWTELNGNLCVSLCLSLLLFMCFHFPSSAILSISLSLCNFLNYISSSHRLVALNYSWTLLWL